MTAKDWQLNVPLHTVQVGDIVDTGERIRRVQSVTTAPGSIVLHLKEGPPYAAEADDLIDVFR
jgi:hypothetical protein